MDKPNQMSVQECMLELSKSYMQIFKNYLEEIQDPVLAMNLTNEFFNTFFKSQRG